MSANGESILDKALAKLAQQEAEVIKTKTLINQMRELLGEPPMFSELGEVSSVASRNNPALSIRMDQFFGQPLATAVREVLELRKKAGLGAASGDEIYAALVRGGFDFPAKDEREQRRGLMISLAKNSVAFRKLPNDTFGLVEWYPARPFRERIRRASDPIPPSTASNGHIADQAAEAAASPAAPATEESTEGQEQS
jgi:hypothetical protein